MGETPKTALPPQDRAASPRPRCIAPKLRNVSNRLLLGATRGEFNSPFA
ncbi:hypothetical protein BJP36_42515 [Moorena producens JHB]|uniref:Uncharacterized protein n=1 Tax=Moorena producens (strain JHB) TaxID=1454205 RepID=A0A9Q9UVP6_MOOP1|nr:hypothetical protein [Moorena producens]WAN69031.1 hypothetical protein BJP36_42515 [Moorena producens JHB]